MSMLPWEHACFAVLGAAKPRERRSEISIRYLLVLHILWCPQRGLNQSGTTCGTQSTYHLIDDVRSCRPRTLPIKYAHFLAMKASGRLSAKPQKRLKLTCLPQTAALVQSWLGWCTFGTCSFIVSRLRMVSLPAQVGHCQPSSTQRPGIGAGPAPLWP